MRDYNTGRSSIVRFADAGRPEGAAMTIDTTAPVPSDCDAVRYAELAAAIRRACATHPEAIAVRQEQVARLLGIHLNAVHVEIAAGRLARFYCGRHALITIGSIVRLIATATRPAGAAFNGRYAIEVAPPEVAATDGAAGTIGGALDAVRRAPRKRNTAA